MLTKMATYGAIHNVFYDLNNLKIARKMFHYVYMNTIEITIAVYYVGT